jgi:hypothetical protein
MRPKHRKLTFNEINLGSNLKKVRNQLDKMTKATYTFKDLITVIALKQGIGKTHMFTEYGKNHWKKEKIILASPRHNHLEEVSKKLFEFFNKFSKFNIFFS